MTTYYNIHPKFYVAVDCIIFGFNKEGLSLLLLKRNMEPFYGAWSLMGGFVQTNESVDDAAKRVLREYTGLNQVYMEQWAHSALCIANPRSGSSLLHTTHLSTYRITIRNV